MRAGSRALVWLVLVFAAVLAAAQATSGTPAPDSTPAATAHELEHQFFAILKTGDALQFLSYIPEDGVNLGRYADHATRAGIEGQLTHRTGLYCKLFDSSCMQPPDKTDAETRSCSYRELLTHSEKVRTASTETTRNGVRQAILVAEVHNQNCAGPALIDFIFNYHQSGWKLFSIP